MEGRNEGGGYVLVIQAPRSKRWTPTACWLAIQLSLISDLGQVINPSAENKMDSSTWDWPQAFTCAHTHAPTHIHVPPHKHIHTHTHRESNLLSSGLCSKYFNHWAISTVTKQRIFIVDYKQPYIGGKKSFRTFIARKKCLYSTL